MSAVFLKSAKTDDNGDKTIGADLIVSSSTVESLSNISESLTHGLLLLGSGLRQIFDDKFS